MMKLRWMPVFLGAAVCVQAQHMPGQFEDGSAEAYVDSKTGKPIVPRIEEKDDKRYYYWPNFHKWKNGKNQLHNERTA